MDEKALLRREILKNRDGIDPSLRRTKDIRIAERLIALPEFTRAGTIFFFSSFRSEVSTSRPIGTALSLGKRVVLPRVDIAAMRLVLYEIAGAAGLEPGYMGIPEPPVSEERRREIDTVDLVIMPGAAFDARGNRLGYGGGYYDRVLAFGKKGLPLIALAYEEQIVDVVPAEAHDIRVHLIVTDARTIDCRVSS